MKTPATKVITIDVVHLDAIRLQQEVLQLRARLQQLSALLRVILFADGGPIVLCAVDWTGIGNAAHDLWREKLAEAAGTTADRVAVHVCHQHDAPAADYSSGKILAVHGMKGVMFDLAFADEGLRRAVRAVREAADKPRRATHLGYGKWKVEKVASTRRVLTPNGKLAFWRSSRGGNKRGSAAPEGLIDP
ncbi:MAG: hypothetical protein QGG71_26430, partial [Pirellulaceae bacterium]|nr:hypothetical protein [Pirellulaceae bacterium]